MKHKSNNESSNFRECYSLFGPAFGLSFLIFIRASSQPLDVELLVLSFQPWDGQTDHPYDLLLLWRICIMQPLS